RLTPSSAGRVPASAWPGGAARAGGRAGAPVSLILVMSQSTAIVPLRRSRRLGNTIHCRLRATPAQTRLNYEIFQEPKRKPPLVPGASGAGGVVDAPFPRSPARMGRPGTLPPPGEGRAL